MKRNKIKFEQKYYSMGYNPPNGIFYRRACKYMGIDPDNNPNIRKRTDYDNQTEVFRYM